MDVYSHGATIIDVWGQLHVAEALQEGTKITKWEDAGYDKYDLKDLKLKTPRKPYSKVEQEIISKAAIKSVCKITRYDFFGLLWQIKRVNNAKNTSDPNWSGPTGDKSEKRTYCTEDNALWANVVRPNTFKYPWATNPVDVDINQYYINKDIN